MLKLKICGLTQAPQAITIAKLGVDAIGFICVTSSPRYIAPDPLAEIVQALGNIPKLSTVGVFANAGVEQLITTVNITGINTIQLHGQESTDQIKGLRQKLPNIQIIKALRIKDQASLGQAKIYAPLVDILLLDAYHPEQLGGTGLAWDWSLLRNFRPDCEWWLAGGLNPDIVMDAVKLTSPDGVDLSSGVELSPGIKNLTKVQALTKALESFRPEPRHQSIN